MLKKHGLWFWTGLLILALVSPGAYAKHWVLLGTAHVDKNDDHKTIHVGSAAGQFHQLQLRVNGAAIDLQRMVVHFEDGTQVEPPVSDRIRAGAKTADIDLPGKERRSIESVELWFSKEYAETRPEVSLYGAQ